MEMVVRLQGLREVKIKSDLNIRINFKNKSYDTLIVKLKEIEATTDNNMVPKNVNFFRTKSLKKINALNNAIIE
jgi:hypothetical protein